MKRSKRISNALSLLTIANKLSSSNAIFLYENLNRCCQDVFCEIIFNTLYNINRMKLTKHKLTRIRKLLAPCKKEFEALAKRSTSERYRKRLIKKQINNGVLGKLFSAVLPSVTSLEL